MPHKNRHDVPEWVYGIDDECLFAIVMEAIVAKAYAIKGGAEHHRPCAAAVRSGDTILSNIEDGRFLGRRACKAASDAVRKFTVAAECAHPTARVNASARRKTAPKTRRAR